MSGTTLSVVVKRSVRGEVEGSRQVWKRRQVQTKGGRRWWWSVCGVDQRREFAKGKEKQR